MNGEAIALFVLGIGGAACMAGGLVFYRASTTAGRRAVGASLLAAGAAMWLLLAVVIPVSVSGNAAPDPVEAQAQ